MTTRYDVHIWKIAEEKKIDFGTVFENTLHHILDRECGLSELEHIEFMVKLDRIRVNTQECKDPNHTLVVVQSGPQ